MKSIRSILLILVLSLLFALSAYSTAQAPEAAPPEAPSRAQTATQTGDTDMKTTLQLTINDTPVSVAWEANASAQALKNLAASKPLTVALSMYGGFEQVGPLGAALPRNDKQITTSAGDIVLYSGNQIVLFYGSNTWSYTRLGKITGLTQAELTALLGSRDTTITLSLAG